MGALGFLEKGAWLWGFWEERPGWPLLTQGPTAAYPHPPQPRGRRDGEQLAHQGLLPMPSCWALKERGYMVHVGSCQSPQDDG